MLGKFRPGEAELFPERIGLDALGSQIPSGLRQFGHGPPAGEHHLGAETCSSKQLILHTIKVYGKDKKRAEKDKKRAEFCG